MQATRYGAFPIPVKNERKLQQEVTGNRSLTTDIEADQRRRPRVIKRKYSCILAILFAHLIALQASAWQQDGRHFRVEGVVKDENGAPIARAEITIDQAGPRIRTVTDNEGRFVFEDIG